MADNPYRKSAPQPASWWAPTSIPLDILTWALPACIISAVGYKLGSWFDHPRSLAVGVVMIWSAGLLVAGWDIVREQTASVVERFGGFYAVKFRRLRWINPFFDKVVQQVPLQARPYKMYSDDPARAEIDFTDASAPIYATAWLSVGDPEAIAKKQWDLVCQDVSLYAYRCDNPVGLALAALDDSLRPLLQSQSIQTAQTNSEALCVEAVRRANDALMGVGMYPNTAGKALMLQDIDIPNAVQEIREGILRGQIDMLRKKTQYQGMMLAIEGVMDAARAANITITYPQAYEQVLAQMQIEALKESKANFNVFGSDLMNAVSAIAGNFKKGAAAV